MGANERPSLDTIEGNFGQFFFTKGAETSARAMFAQVREVIADRYMELPTDIDGVPCHMNEFLRTTEHGKEPSIIVLGYVERDGKLYVTDGELVADTAALRHSPFPSDEVRRMIDENVKLLVDGGVLEKDARAHAIRITKRLLTLAAQRMGD